MAHKTLSQDIFDFLPVTSGAVNPRASIWHKSNEVTGTEKVYPPLQHRDRRCPWPIFEPGCLHCCRVVYIKLLRNNLTFRSGPSGFNPARAKSRDDYDITVVQAIAASIQLDVTMGEVQRSREVTAGKLLFCLQISSQLNYINNKT